MVTEGFKNKCRPKKGSRIWRHLWYLRGTQRFQRLKKEQTMFAEPLHFTGFLPATSSFLLSKLHPWNSQVLRQTLLTTPDAQKHKTLAIQLSLKARDKKHSLIMKINHLTLHLLQMSWFLPAGHKGSRCYWLASSLSGQAQLLYSQNSVAFAFHIHHQRNKVMT